jgi:hypothetical protein
MKRIRLRMQRFRPGLRGRGHEPQSLRTLDYALPASCNRGFPQFVMA